MMDKASQELKAAIEKVHRKYGPNLQDFFNSLSHKDQDQETTNSMNNEALINPESNPADPAGKYGLRVMIAPLTGQERHFWVCPELNGAMLTWVMDKRVQKENGGEVLYWPGHNYPTSQEARNAITTAFLKTGADYLVMVDNDTAPFHPLLRHPVNVMDLAAMGLPIVAAPVPVVKDADLEWHLNGYMRMGSSYRNITEKELTDTTEVDAVGFGLVVLRRDVVERMEHSRSRYGEGPDERINWDAPNGLDRPAEKLPNVMRSRRLDGSTAFGEDLLYCARAKDEGFKIYMAGPQYTCGHYHTMDYGKLGRLKFAMYGPADLGLDNFDPSTMTGYEMSFQTLAWLREWIKREKPRRVIELGSGLSTVVIGKALQAHQGLVLSWEQDKEQAAKTGYQLAAEGVYGENAAVCVSSLGPDGFYRSIDTFSKAELMVVDGPSGDHNSRGYALYRFADSLLDGAIILLDDINREYEAAVLQEWVATGGVEVLEIVDRTAVLCFHKEKYEAFVRGFKERTTEAQELPMGLG